MGKVKRAFQMSESSILCYLHIILLPCLSDTIPVTGSRHLASVWTLPSAAARVRSVQMCRTRGPFQERSACAFGFYGINREKKMRSLSFTHGVLQQLINCKNIFAPYVGRLHQWSGSKWHWETLFDLEIVANLIAFRLELNQKLYF